MGPGTGIRRIWKAAALVAVGAAGGGAALAVASVPDSNGVINACYQITPEGVPVAAPNLRIIDPSNGQTCSTTTGVDGQPPSEATLSWNAIGRRGPQGVPGKAVTVAGGNTLTLPGGDVVTVGGSHGVTVLTPPPPANSKPIATVQLNGGTKPLSFEINSFSFGQSNPGQGGGGGSGKTSVHDIGITKKVDKTSPTLSLACASGKHFSKGTLTLRKAGSSKPYLTYTLTNVLISSFQVESSGKTPIENMSLAFEKLQESSTSK